MSYWIGLPVKESKDEVIDQFPHVSGPALVNQGIQKIVRRLPSDLFRSAW
ncbi:MAG: hypothetical protein JXA79_12015 [Deltaproteobacteria bacterium]|nr:hypothetical protein [Deltaproteobacteria bacterium]